jgi:hypothetical protein
VFQLKILLLLSLRTSEFVGFSVHNSLLTFLKKPIGFLLCFL